MPKATTQRRFLRIKRAQRERDFLDLSETLERQLDPFEQAKTFLRRRGYMVAPEKCGRCWIIGRRRYQPDEALVDIAERNGWNCPARDAAEIQRRTRR